METGKSPWEVLGIAESASDEQVKLAWRKLILKCHPDKAAEDQKEAKAEEFKSVNEAYKTITEPDLRKKYEDDKERRQRFAETGAPGSTYGTTTPAPRHYNTRTAAPSSTYGGTTREAPASEYSRSPEDYFDDTRASSRKYDGYDAHYSSSRRDSPRTPRSSKESAKMAKESEKASRSDRRKRDDRAEKRERKFMQVESDSDDRGVYEDTYNQRSEEARNRERYMEESSRRFEDARKSDDRKYSTKSRGDKYDDRSHKYYSQEDEARDYMARSMHSARPSYTRRTTSGTPESSYVRRSSARRDSERTPRERRRGSGPEIVDYAIPEMKHSNSSPANFKGRVPPTRSTSDYPAEHKAPPGMRRSETMPTATSRNAKDAAPMSASKLRTEAAVGDSGYSSPTADEIHASPLTSTPSQKYAAYTYSPGAGLSPIDDNYRTVLREPEPGRRRKSRSPARTSRSSRYPSKPVTPIRTASYRVAEPSSSSEDLPRSRPSLFTNSVRHTEPGSMRDATNRRSPDRDPLLFNEIPKSSSRNTRYDNVSYAKNYDRKDVSYGSGYERNAGRDYNRPPLHRSSTAAY